MIYVFKTSVLFNNLLSFLSLSLFIRIYLYLFCVLLLSNLAKCLSDNNRNIEVSEESHVESMLAPIAFFGSSKNECGQVNNMSVRVSWFYRVNCRLCNELAVSVLVKFDSCGGLCLIGGQVRWDEQEQIVWMS